MTFLQRSHLATRSSVSAAEARALPALKWLYTENEVGATAHLEGRVEGVCCIWTRSSEHGDISPLANSSGGIEDIQ